MSFLLIIDKKLKTNTRRILRYISLCCDILKKLWQNLCHDRIFSCRNYMKKFCLDKEMNVARLKDKVSGPDRETMSRQVMLT